MNKTFNVGDIVICIAAGLGGFPGKPGEIFEVESLTHNDSLNFAGEKKGADPARFELYQPVFEEGDRVVFRVNYGNAKIGDAGRVGGILPNYHEGHALHIVQMDDGSTRQCFGHRLLREPVAAQVASVSPFEKGARVVLTEAHDGEPEGASGEVVEFFRGSPVVRFDDSGDEVVCEDYQLMPEPEVVREFRILTQYGMGSVSYPSEQDAVDAHLTAGFPTAYAGSEFEIVEITRVAKFKVEAQPNIAVRVEAEKEAA
ncbi:hypothetical protein HOR55_gp37 [Ralstonia phage RS-PII-1]|uniref:Uncharacterized protein n=1 Tax=Ralstonia phage RS-PII-1 TaxID=1932892 RepID=A0A1L7DQH9_9CAUD|nr:hypothetical protein HOR55_gp37 [Ralstonia phage RS-PII-1]APU00324.1 hypothetical protein [Ralstonia phage RS-PII-1]